MELLHNLAVGFGVALTPANLFFALTGALIGTLIGVLPGIGPIATIAMLLPLTFHLEPTSGLIMLAGIYYGAQYGGSTTAILINLPGESSAAVTALDGHQMARQGRAGPALATAALGSFFAGTVATAVVALFAPPMASVALEFGPADYFSLVVLGLVISIALASGSTVKALAMIVLGLLLGTVGQDLFSTGVPRFTFGIRELYQGRQHTRRQIGHGPDDDLVDAVPAYLVDQDADRALAVLISARQLGKLDQVVVSLWAAHQQLGDTHRRLILSEHQRTDPDHVRGVPDRLGVELVRVVEVLGRVGADDDHDLGVARGSHARHGHPEQGGRDDEGGDDDLAQA